MRNNHRKSIYLAISVYIFITGICSAVAETRNDKQIKPHAAILLADFNTFSSFKILPSGFSELSEITPLSTMNFAPEFRYEKVLSSFSNVFSQSFYYSQAIFVNSLISESVEQQLDPCFVVGLMSSTYQKRLPKDQVNLVSLFGQDDSQSIALGQLLGLGAANKRALYSEHYVARLTVRYIAMLRELLGHSSTLVALAWQLGFDELALRMKNENFRSFTSEDLNKLQVARAAIKLCESGLTDTSKSYGIRASFKFLK